MSHLSLGLLMFIAQSLLSKTSWLSESTVPINLHHCNPYKVLVHSADVAASQGCSCDSFSMTLCTFKHRKRICTYLSHIYKDFIIILDYVRLSRNLYIHYVRLSRNLYIHYVRLRPTLVFCCWNFVVLRNNEHCCQFFYWLNDLFGKGKFTKLSEKPNYSWYLSINFSQNLVFFGGRKIVFILVKKCSPNTVKVEIFPYIFPKNIHQI